MTISSATSVNYSEPMNLKGQEAEKLNKRMEICKKVSDIFFKMTLGSLMLGVSLGVIALPFLFSGVGIPAFVGLKLASAACHIVAILGVTGMLIADIVSSCARSKLQNL